LTSAALVLAFAVLKHVVPGLGRLGHAQRHAVDLGDEVPADRRKCELLAGARIHVANVAADAAQLFDEHRFLAVPAVEQPQHAAVEGLAHGRPAEAVPKLPLALAADLRRAEAPRHAAELARPPCVDRFDGLALGGGQGGHAFLCGLRRPLVGSTGPPCVEVPVLRLHRRRGEGGRPAKARRAARP